MIRIVVAVIIICILLQILRRKYIRNPDKCDISKNGFKRLSIFTSDEVNYMKVLVANGDITEVKKFISEHWNMNQHITSLLGGEYVFHDYVLALTSTPIHTCHRDNNGDKFNKSQLHPSYTIIVYLEPVENCLNVINGSHKHYVGAYLNDPTQGIKCSVGDAILFDANLYHGGALGNDPRNLRIQMKISHIDDLNTLSFYQNYNKILDKDAKTSKNLRYIQKHLSCQYPVVSDITNSEHKGKEPSSIVKYFSNLFYGDSNFYNLKNV